MNYYDIYQQGEYDLCPPGTSGEQCLSHDAYGLFRFNQYAIGHSIDLIRMISHLNQAVRLHADGEERRTPIVTVVAFLSGHTNICMPGFNKVTTNTETISFIYSPGHDGHMEFLPDPADSIIVRMTLDRFLNNIANDHRPETLQVFSSLFDNQKTPLYLTCKRTSNMNRLLQDLISPSSPFAANLLRDARVHELFFEVVEEIIRSKGKEKNLFSCYDRQKLINAKRVLLERIDNPPSIIELSKEVGLNDFKLKKGFRSLFDNTVYGVVLEARLEKARQLLTQPGLSVTQISLQVGYSNHGHFSAAFKKRFGMTPREFGRQYRQK